MTCIKPVRSAIYLSGNKYKLFKGIAPHLAGRKVLVDLFTGSGCVSLNAVNCELGFEKIIANDSMQCIIDIHKQLQSNTNGFLETVGWQNIHYTSTEEGYFSMRDSYNVAPLQQPYKLYLLNCRSNSNMIRFNNDGKFNVPYGKRNCFSAERLEKHAELCKGIEFHCEDYSTMIDKLYRMDLDFKDVVVYIDSPYSGTDATYNKNWNWKEDYLLLSRVLSLHEVGAKIVMSNVFENRGNVNQWLIDWCEEHKDKFEVHYMDISYGNSSFRKSDKKTQEVLITSR